MKGNNFFYKMIILTTMLVVMFSLAVNAANFSDVNTSHWAYGAIETLTNKGVITGFPDGSYKPNEAVTREQFAKVLVEGLGLTKTEGIVEFEDVNSSRWSKEYIDSAVNYLTGYTISNKYYFRPAAASVREDMAVAMVKANGLQNEIPDYTLLDRFTDKDQITAGLEGYIAIAVENGIMQGNDNGTFNPQGTLTRAQMATLLNNVIRKVDMSDATEENNNEMFKTTRVLSADYEGRTDVEPKKNASFYVRYNNGIKSAEVLVVDKNGETKVKNNVNNLDGKLEVTKDNKNIIIRMNIEPDQKYTVTISNVIDIDENKVSDYTYSFETKSSIPQVLTNVNIMIKNGDAVMIPALSTISSKIQRNVITKGDTLIISAVDSDIGTKNDVLEIQYKSLENAKNITTSGNSASITMNNVGIQELYVRAKAGDGKVSEWVKYIFSIKVEEIKIPKINVKVEEKEISANETIIVKNGEKITITGSHSSGIEKICYSFVKDSTGSMQVSSTMIQSSKNPTTITINNKAGKYTLSVYVVSKDGQKSETVKYKFNVVEETSVTKYGDVDLNGTIDEKDAELILKYCVELVTLNKQQIENADVNLDGTVNTGDATIILRYLSSDWNIELPYTPQVTTKYGDVDLNGTIDKKDAELVLKYSTGLVNLNEQQKENADVNFDGKIDTADATLIQKYPSVNLPYVENIF